MCANIIRYGLVVFIVGALLTGCGNEATISEDSALGGRASNSLIVNAAAAGTINISTITWVDDCFLDDPGMGIYRDETFILAAVGTRTVSQLFGRRLYDTNLYRYK